MFISEPLKVTVFINRNSQRFIALFRVYTVPVKLKRFIPA